MQGYTLPLHGATTTAAADTTRRGAILTCHLIRTDRLEGDDRGVAPTGSRKGTGADFFSFSDGSSPVTGLSTGGSRGVDIGNGNVMVVATGRGDLAPLPGLHAESLSTALAQLTSLTASLEGQPVPHLLFSSPEGDRSRLGRPGVVGQILDALLADAGTPTPAPISISTSATTSSSGAPY